MKRYYEFDEQGNYLCSYACPQLNKNLILLDENEVSQYYFPKYVKGVVVEGKTLIELKQWKFTLLRNKMLNNPLLKELRNAMTSQEVFRNKGSNPNKAIFTDQQIKDWGDYFGNIAKDGQDLTNYSLEEINESIFGTMPEIPEAYQSLII